MIERVSDLIDEVERLYREWKPGEEGLWYRGLKDNSFSLTPSFYRQQPEPEHHVVVEFISQAAPLLSQTEMPKGDLLACEWQWYFLMQHYGTPTRLLDWTELPLAALYFAVRELADSRATETLKGKPCVWVLNPASLNEFSIEDTEVLVPVGQFTKNWLYRKSVDADYGVVRTEPLRFSYCNKQYSNERPIAIYPVRANNRIIAQRGVFTVHGADDRSLEAIYSPNEAGHQLTCLKIDVQSIQAILKQLDHLGVNEFALFPELTSLSAHIKRMHGID